MQQDPPPIMIVQPRRRRWAKPPVIIGVLIGLIILFGAAGVLYTNRQYQEGLRPRSSDQAGIRVTVQSGMDGQAIGNLLQEKEIIRSGKVFTQYLKKTNNNDLKAGTYLLAPSMSVPEIVTLMVQGKVDNFKLTLTPGRTVSQIKESLVKSGFDQKPLEAALSKKYTHKLLESKPQNADLEGYIFPETYQLTSDMTPEAFIAHTFDIFYAQIEDQGLLSDLKEKNLTLHEAFTLASIVQQEVSNKADMSKVAQVFLKRLSIDMPLGADPTFKYASRKAGVPDNLNIDSPYNTRKYPGLPPGPIGNFTITALEAVAHPADTDYLFFVAGDDGTTYFSNTQEEHEALTRQHCTKLCQ